MIRLAWERLPEAVHRHRIRFLEVAAQLHRAEPFTWLFRDADEMEREPVAILALENRLSDALELAIEQGFKPWSWRCRELAAA
jgi:hypothetical protein